MNVSKTILAAAVLVLAGCATDKAVPFVTTDTPALPAECDPEQVKPAREPKVEADIPEGASDLVATRDRNAWKSAYRQEKANRRACKQRLEALFPQKK